MRGITEKHGVEHLGSDGKFALQTPLATWPAFNGWDDQFLTTPAGGVEHRYLAITGCLVPNVLRKLLSWTVGYLAYYAVSGVRYGSEAGASLRTLLGKDAQALLKVAHHHANGFGHDNTKISLQREWRGKKNF